MMMDCLSAGGRPKGLRCEWSRRRDKMMNSANADGEFRPNESYREIELKEYSELDFPLRYDETLIKVMSWGLEQMRRTEGFCCVFLVRDAFEIAESYSRSFGKELTVVENGVKLPAIESQSWPRVYNQEMKSAIIKAETRVDCASLHVMRYNDVLENPLSCFSRLRDSGWPVDADIAAGVVDRKRKRVGC